MYDNLIITDMEVKIENMVFGWHEELPEMFIELLNTLVLTKNEQDVRGVMEVFARKELFQCPFRIRVWRTPFMGDAEKGIRPRPMFGEQITNC